MEYFLSLTNNVYIVEGFGALAFIFMTLALQMKRRTYILYIQALGMAFLGIHLLLLSALTGAAIMVVLVLRNIIFAQKDHWKWAGSIFVYYGMIIAITLSGALLWQGWVSLFAIIGSIVATYGLWETKPKKIRVALLLSVFVWFVYGVIVLSYSLLALQCFLATSLLIAIWRYDWNKSIDGTEA